MATSPDESGLKNYDVDDFVVDYIKYRIEFDDKYTWYDAPETSSEFVDEYYAVRKIAQDFERRNAAKLKQKVGELIAHGPLTYNDFVTVIFWTCSSPSLPPEIPFFFSKRIFFRSSTILLEC